VNIPPQACSDFTDFSVGNASIPTGDAEWYELDRAMSWTAAVRRAVVFVPTPAIIAATAGVASKMRFRIPVPAFCLGVQWCVAAIGDGFVRVQETAEAFYSEIRVFRDTAFGAPLPPDLPYVYTARTRTAAPLADGERRPLNVTTGGATGGLTATKLVDLWIVDTGGGADAVQVFGLGFLPLPRYTWDANLV
jgi:hypothetical protein